MKIIKINWDSLKSIEKAERLKVKYENMGGTLIRQTHNSLTYKFQ